jgi:hypothetical protein
MEAAETVYEVDEASVTATAHLHFKDRGPMPNSLLAILRRLGTDFLAFFRFTEADARALLSAYGLNALEIDGPAEVLERAKESGGKFRSGDPSPDMRASPEYSHRCPSRFRSGKLDTLKQVARELRFRPKSKIFYLRDWKHPEAALKEQCEPRRMEFHPQ